MSSKGLISKLKIRMPIDAEDAEGHIHQLRLVWGDALEKLWTNPYFHFN